MWVGSLPDGAALDVGSFIRAADIEGRRRARGCCPSRTLRSDEWSIRRWGPTCTPGRGPRRRGRYPDPVPELPEVETIRRQLEPLVGGRTVIAADSHPATNFVAATEVNGARIQGVRRRGKYLIIPLADGRELIVHLGMTGSLRIAPPDEPADPYVRARWRLDRGGVLEFRDVRRFGRVAVVDAGDYRSLPTLANLGPEPLSPGFDGEVLWAGLRRSDRRVKTQLLSQRPVAGVGNIYADEALFRARVNPALRRVTRAQATRLAREITAVLTEGIEHGGTTLRDYRTVSGDRGGHQFHLVCYGRAGEPCVRCGQRLAGRVLDGRSTTWCRNCQAR